MNYMYNFVLLDLPQLHGQRSGSVVVTLQPTQLQRRGAVSIPLHLGQNH